MSENEWIILEINRLYDECEGVIGRIPGRADPLPTKTNALESRLESVQGLYFSIFSQQEHIDAALECAKIGPVPKQVGGAPNFTESDFPGEAMDPPIEWGDRK